MHNLGTVFRFEFIRTIKKWSFWISALFVPVLLGLIIGINLFSVQTADRAEQQTKNDKFSVVVKDDSGLLDASILAAAGAKVIENKGEGIEAVKTAQAEAFFYYPAQPSKQPVEAYGTDVGLAKNGRYEEAARNLLQQSIAASIDSDEKTTLLRQPPQVSSITFEANGTESPGFARVLAPGIFLVFLWFASFMFSGQMLASTTEEKENRVIEMVLTTIRARTLIVGKILAIVASGLLQIFIMAAPALIAYLLFRQQLNLPSLDLSHIPIDPLQMAVGAALFVGSFVLLTGLTVAIGAAAPTAKEANSFLGAIYLPLFAPLWASASIVTDPGALVVKIFSFFPLTAPTTLLLRNTVGNLSIGEALVGITILAITGILAIGIAVRVFRYGTIEYARRISLKEIFMPRA